MTGRSGPPRAGAVTIAARLLLVALAVPAGGWLLVQERAARAEGRLAVLAFQTRGELTPEQVRRGEALLRADRRLNPDRRPDLYEAVLLGRQGRAAEAVAVLRGSVRSEPESLEAWALLARAAAEVNPRVAATARARARVLAPPVPPG